MLQELREKVHSWLAYVIIGLLILSFGLWGVSSYLHGGSVDNVVAKVNGEEITTRQFDSAYKENQRSQQINLGADYSSSMDQILKQQTLKSMITNIALVQYLHRSHFRISSTVAELAIYHLPAFTVKGAFSPERYKQYLYSVALSDAQFIRQFQTSMMERQLRSGLLDSNFALPNEIALNIGYIQQTRELQYALIHSSPNAHLAVSKADIASYYQAHKEAYKLPEKIKIAYILLSPTEFMPKTKPTDEKLKKYYRNHISQFTVKKSKTEKVESFSSVKNKVKTAYLSNIASDLYMKALDTVTNLSYEQPNTLLPAAKAVNLKVQTTDYITRSSGDTKLAKNKAFIAAAFSDEVLVGGNNSDMVQIDSNTSLVLRVLDHKDASYKSLKLVRPEIIRSLKNQNRAKQEKKIALKITGAITKGESLEKIEKLYHVSFVRTPYLNRFSQEADQNIITDAFMKSNVPNQKQAYVVNLAKDGVAVYRILAVKPGLLTKEKKTSEVNYSQQIKEANAMSEYAFLIDGVIQKTKVKINQPQ
jgi:peptidyl-prolyl cis-trans isomerase D